MNKYLLAISLLLLGPVAKAQIHFSALTDVMAYADKHAVTIRTSEMDQQIARSKQKEASAFLYPALNANAGFNDNLTLQPTLVPEQLFNPAAPDGSFKEMTFGKQYLYSTGLQAQWNLVDFQKLFARKTASIQYAAGLANTARVRFNTYNQLASTYYAILLTRYSLGLYERNLAATKEMLLGAEDKYARGVISEADRNLVAIEHLQNEKNVNGSRQDLELLVKQLQGQLNTSDTISTDADTLQAPILQAPGQIAQWPIHPDVRWQQLEVELAKSALNETRSLNYPSLGITYQYNHNWATNSFMDFSSANHLPQQYIGLRLNVPLFTGFSTKQKIVQSGLLLQQQQLQLQALQHSKAKEDEILVLQYEQAQMQWKKDKDILELQEKNDYHIARQYQEGIISIDTRMDKYRNLLAAQNTYLQSLSNLTLAQYKIYIRQINDPSNEKK
ncbi:TolC family protein [Filimonas effusa]|uniref:TolC family protein n=1 Tax=Filimonas effusa TaxID=2508721 RepID=A0A4Q1DB19_9BACT|nr:TolC family protein [Filimonas effusa]RXK85689.1 TolC family protein [Filimonas effusa]